jgi:hypothetical protein
VPELWAAWYSPLPGQGRNEAKVLKIIVLTFAAKTI